jgi:hypothetical protein
MKQFFEKYKQHIFVVAVTIAIYLMDIGKYTRNRIIAYCGVLFALVICLYLFSGIKGNVEINFKKRIFTLVSLFFLVFIIFTSAVILYSMFVAGR